MNRFTHQIARLALMLRIALVTAVLGSPMAAQAETTETHHFAISKPATIFAGVPFDIEITAKSADDKMNKEANLDLLVQITTIQGAKTQTETMKVQMTRGLARATVTAKDLGFAFLQVSDEKNPELNAVASINALPQPRKRGVRS